MEITRENRQGGRGEGVPSQPLLPFFLARYSGCAAGQGMVFGLSALNRVHNFRCMFLTGFESVPNRAKLHDHRC